MSYKGIYHGRDVELPDFEGEVAAMDGMIEIHRYLNSLQQDNGEYIRNDEGEVTSHLIGLNSKFANYLLNDVQLIFVLDGGAPDLKDEEIERRSEGREEAQKLFEKAKMEGDTETMKSLRYKRVTPTSEIIESSIRLAEAYGIPVVRAPSEGEPQCAQLVKDDQADFVASKDYDTLYYEVDRLAMNMQPTSGSLIDLPETMMEREIDYDELKWFGILTGTDYNNSPKGVGTWRGLKIVKAAKNFDEVVEEALSRDEERVREDRWYEVYDWLQNPNTDSVDVDITPPDSSELSDIWERYELAPKNGVF